MSELAYRAGFRGGVKHMEQSTRQMADDLRKALTIIELVTQLHQPYECNCGDERCSDFCDICGNGYPCETMKIINGVKK